MAGEGKVAKTITQLLRMTPESVAAENAAKGVTKAVVPYKYNKAQEKVIKAIEGAEAQGMIDGKEASLLLKEAKNVTPKGAQKVLKEGAPDFDNAAAARKSKKAKAVKAGAALAGAGAAGSVLLSDSGKEEVEDEVEKPTPTKPAPVEEPAKEPAKEPVKEPVKEVVEEPEPKSIKDVDLSKRVVVEDEDEVISPLEKSLNQLQAANAAAVDEYRKEKSNIKRRQMWEAIVNGVGLMAAGAYGLKTGLNMGGLKLDKTNWDAEYRAAKSMYDAVESGNKNAFTMGQALIAAKDKALDRKIAAAAVITKKAQQDKANKYTEDGLALRERTTAVAERGADRADKTLDFNKVKATLAAVAKSGKSDQKSLNKFKADLAKWNKKKNDFNEEVMRQSATEAGISLKEVDGFFFGKNLASGADQLRNAAEQTAKPTATTTPTNTEAASLGLSDAEYKAAEVEAKKYGTNVKTYLISKAKLDAKRGK